MRLPPTNKFAGLQPHVFMNSLEKLHILSDELGGLITTHDAVENGVSRATLSRLCKQGHLERIAQGQYIFPDEFGDELLSLSLRFDHIVFSHETALYLHGLSDRVPFEHSLTTPSNCVPPVSIIKRCSVYYIKTELLSLGKTRILSPSGNLVPTYDVDRTICDVIRSRNRMGYETFLYAIKAYARLPNKRLDHLYEYAKAMNVLGIVKQYMEVLL